LPSKPLSLDRMNHRRSPKPKDRYFMPREASANDLRRAGIFE